MKKLFLLGIIAILLNGCTAIQPTNKVGSNESNTQDTDKSIIETTKNNSLNLSYQKLGKIPEYVFDQINLEELDISNNQLTGSIQAEIRHLKNLKILNASNNMMTGVPAEIGQLSNLEILNLSNNQLTGLPLEIGNLKNLKIFDISGNYYSKYDFDIIKKSLSENVNIIN